MGYQDFNFDRFLDTESNARIAKDRASTAFEHSASTLGKHMELEKTVEELTDDNTRFRVLLVRLTKRVEELESTHAKHGRRLEKHVASIKAHRARLETLEGHGASATVAKATGGPLRIVTPGRASQLSRMEDIFAKADQVIQDPILFGTVTGYAKLGDLATVRAMLVKAEGGDADVSNLSNTVQSMLDSEAHVNTARARAEKANLAPEERKRVLELIKNGRVDRALEILDQAGA